MQTTPLRPEQFSTSVLAVPPLARNSDEQLCLEENRKLVRYLEDGGVSMLLYGGNANLYHIRPSEFERLLTMLRDIAGENTLVIPSAGPAYGTMMDQADILKDFDFPTAMVLPTKAIMTEAGLMTGFRRFVERIGRPAVLYIKEEGYISRKVPRNSFVTDLFHSSSTPLFAKTRQMTRSSRSWFPSLILN